MQAIFTDWDEADPLLTGLAVVCLAGYWFSLIRSFVVAVLATSGGETMPPPPHPVVHASASARTAAMLLRGTVVL